MSKQKKVTKQVAKKGKGGIEQPKRFNWARAIPVALVLLVTGGYLVFRSSAGSDVKLENRAFSIVPDQLSGGKLVTKANGRRYVTISPATPVSSLVTYQELAEAGSVCIEYLSSVKSFDINVSYTSPEDGKQISLVSGSAYDVDSNNRCIKLDTALVSKLPIIGIDSATVRINLTVVGTSGQIYLLYGLKKDAGKFGFTWTQDNFMVPAAAKSKVANIHMYGWGNLWPFKGDAPDTEADDGSTISNRIKKSTANGQEIMITACCAPSSYNNSGKAWDLDNSRVSDSREQAYADKVAQLVARHPEVKYVQVWNEFKGYWGTDAWDATAYTRFYNKVYTAVKAKRSDVLVGGGYVVLSANSQAYFNKTYNGVNLDRRSVEALKYWMNHAVGFDAVALDAYLAPDDFPKIMSFVRTLPEAKNKPLWWSEFYNRPSPGADFSAAGSPYEVAQKIAPHMKEGDISLYWAERKYISNPNRLLH